MQQKHSSTIWKLFLLAILSIGLYQCKKPEDQSSPVMFGTPQPLEIPKGFPRTNVPADNPQTIEGVELGRHLFYDKRLSADLTQSCASCHAQHRAFSDVTLDPTSTGVDGIKGRRNSMALFNLAFQEKFFWDGRAQSLEEQSLHPIEDPLELNVKLETVIARLEADTAYPEMFAAAFGDNKISKKRIGKAIAQFERTMISANSEFDKVKRISGNIDAPFIEDASTPGSKNNGWLLFKGTTGDCFHCHSIEADGAFLGGSFGVNNQFRNNGLKMKYRGDLGRQGVTNEPSDFGKFKVPSVRNSERTAPFMHDGSVPSLDSVIRFYSFGGFSNGNTDPQMDFAGDAKGTRNLSEEQIDDLEEFLKTLTDWEFLEDPRFSDPFAE
ncbi:cytochrome-c peroxidase [Owenweeksia hongkongensis]|uniref:Methylamine utilization protein MauG n=1 Tax=Owenweeksia hongkongensis (strain DSM 17368 / CIP 108786 / JCM 12287 / NRRL B-23963 / UST20020801) TaxID=926562 RepID=G8R0M9_OWEHD|nr:cytochrome c peroxidase [Owenweeksia hongkongensis]AEV32733.1 cytochrome c peroxidase [Owenweeksia hongkongensis DSM 17368]